MALFTPSARPYRRERFSDATPRRRELQWYRQLAAIAPLLACAPQPATQNPALHAHVYDKAELYGDAGLVPTRQGEHARAELALAGEIDGALRHVEGISALRVSVTLPAAKIGPSSTSWGVPTRVLIAATRRGLRDHQALREDVLTVVRGVVGPIPESEVYLVFESESAQPDHAPQDLPMFTLVGLVGFGFFLGLFLERLRSSPMDLDEA